MADHPPQHTSPPSEGRAILAAIDAVDPSAPTACDGWTQHDIVAHLAAGAKELADLIEEGLHGHPDRPTRGFDEREAPFRALSPDELRNRLVAENKRRLAAYDALGERVENPAISFTGTRVTVAELNTHSRSEAAIHRWDLVGDDDTSGELLAQPDLTAHAVKVLNRMPILNESARALADRAAKAAAESFRITFRSPDRPDVVFVASRGGGRFELAELGAEPDALVTTDAANRLLVLWGRRSSNRAIVIDGDPAIASALPTVFWPNAQTWPRADGARASSIGRE